MTNRPLPALRRRTAPLLLALGLAAVWPVQATDAEPTAQAALAGQRVLGESLFRYWGFEVYHATLRVSPGFDAEHFSAHRFALELQYRRAFAGRDIAQRSIDEMRGQAPLDAATANAWLDTMAALFPDIQPGDRLLGVHVPGQGARFYFNGVLRGAVPDTRFAERFFGIWLAPSTSQPRLRQALLAQNPR